MNHRGTTGGRTATAVAASAAALLLGLTGAAGSGGCGGGSRGPGDTLEGRWRLEALRSGDREAACPGVLTVPRPGPTIPPFFGDIPIATCGEEDTEEYGPGGAYLASGVTTSFGFESYDGGKLRESSGTWRLEGGTLTRQITRGAIDNNRNGVFDPAEIRVNDPPYTDVFSVTFEADGRVRLDGTHPDGHPLSYLLRRR